MAHAYSSKGERTPFDFELDGVAFTCTGNVDIIDLAELGGLADADVDSAQGVKALADVFKVALADDYARFRAHTRAHHTDNDTLIEILRDLVEHVTAGPTKRPSQSVSGPLPINGTSQVDLPSQHEFTDEEIARLRAAIAGSS
jgi:hypothetical protein